jgi:hypothetical protein
MDSSKVEVKKDVINEAIELINVLRKNRKKSVNEVKVKKELMNESFDVQNNIERGNLLRGIVNWSDAARSHP